MFQKELNNDEEQQRFCSYDKCQKQPPEVFCKKYTCEFCKISKNIFSNRTSPDDCFWIVEYSSFVRVKFWSVSTNGWKTSSGSVETAYGSNLKWNVELFLERIFRRYFHLEGWSSKTTWPYWSLSSLSAIPFYSTLMKETGSLKLLHKSDKGMYLKNFEYITFSSESQCHSLYHSR